MRDAPGHHEVAVQAIPQRSAEDAVKARMTLKYSARFYNEGKLKSHCAIVQLLQKRYVTYDSITKLYAEVRDLKQASLASADYAPELLTRTVILLINV